MDLDESFVASSSLALKVPACANVAISYDFTISFAVIKPADQAGPNTVGAPLRRNIDLIATNSTNIVSGV